MLALAIAHFLVVATGHDYLYTTLRYTIFKGRLGPDIREFRFFPSRPVRTGVGQPWNESLQYNAKPLSGEQREYVEGLQTVALLVIHQDSVLYEEYWDSFGPDTLSNSFSMAKSIVSALVGIAIQQGQIDSLDQPIYWYLPEFDTGLGKKLTIRHLLMMASGINFDEDYLNPFAFPARANYGTNLGVLMSHYQVVDTPGVVFTYQSGNTQVLAQALVNARQQQLSYIAQEELWKPIGAENPALWSLDSEGGMERAFCCFNSNARDFARIGKLYLQHGKWNGRQIIDSAYVAQSLSPQGILDEDGGPCTSYGLHWWLGDYQAKKFFYMRGIQGQYVLVVPEEELIVVRLGRQRDKGTGDHPDDVFEYLDIGLDQIKNRKPAA